MFLDVPRRVRCAGYSTAEHNVKSRTDLTNTGESRVLTGGYGSSKCWELPIYSTECPLSIPNSWLCSFSLFESLPYCRTLHIVFIAVFSNYQPILPSEKKPSTFIYTYLYIFPQVFPHRHSSASTKMPAQDIKSVIANKPVSFTVKTGGGKWRCTLHSDRHSL